MALGFGFNKQKVMASAEKAVQQGKLPNAISEYEKVVKEDPKDVYVLNTIGDLYARVGNNEKATFYFRRVGDLYAGEGFTVKAIAVYKKIAKLDPGAGECILKLAELYTQQGLYNDARSQYVQVADAHMKEGNLQDAAKIFQKILELDSENTAMQSKLADLFLKLGRRDDARNIFLKAAEGLYAKGALDAADEALRKVVGMDPENKDALLLRGKVAVDSGDSAAAVTYLEKIPDLDSRPEGLRGLMKAQLQLGKTGEAEVLARKLLTVHNDATGLGSYAEALIKEKKVEPALRIYDQYFDRLLASNAAEVIPALISAIPEITENVAALDLMHAIFVKAGEHNRINEVSEALGQACVHSGQLEKAAAIYLELSELEPENPLHLQNYKQIQSKLGQDPTVREISKEAGQQALMVDELEHQAPPLEQKYSDLMREALKAALTESELFESYSMPSKAIAPLEAVLVKAPEDAQVNQRLASLYARSGRLQDAIARCEVLEKIYREAGFHDQGRQYVEMRRRYQERMEQASKTAAVEYDASFMPGQEMHADAAAPPAAAPPAAEARAAPQAGIAPAPAFGMEFEVTPAATAAAPASAPEFTVAPAPPTPVAQESSAAPAAQSHEIDLSDWEQMTQVEAPAVAGPRAEEIAEEAQFYIAQSLWKEAADAVARLQAIAPQHAGLEQMRQQISAAAAVVTPPAVAAAAPAPAPVAAEATVAEFSFDVAAPAAAPEFAAPAIEPVAAPPPPPPPAPVKAPVKAPPVAAKPGPKEEKKRAEKKPAGALEEFVLELDESLPEDFGIRQPTKAAAPPPAAPKPAPSAQPVAQKRAAPAPAPAPVVAYSDADASAALSDIFAEFKEDVEESADEAEDPDTHYNLGVAFREMGLLDEAIGELQKVCHAIDKGHPFSQVMQAYTWLAHCFLEKGVPEASVKWYEKALTVPSIDEEGKLAVYYELGAAYEAAGNKKRALESFNEVYSNNIDYRDVAERIKALRA